MREIFMSEEKQRQPEWIEEAPAERSWRSIFKWGNPCGFRHPNAKFMKEIRESFALTDRDFQSMKGTGGGAVAFRQPVRLSRAQINRFVSIAGEANVSTDDYERLKYSTGKTMEEAMKLRSGIVDRVCDCVVHPRGTGEVEEIVAFCHRQRIPLYVYGGGSSVNFGLRPVKGGVSLVLCTHMNRVLDFSEENQSVTVQAGIFGPALEESLNSAPAFFGAKRPYTCGHFPQSFQYSSVGGWIVTLGSGQQSSYYGDACDMLLALTLVTPQGTIRTLDYPAAATGPKVLDMVKGSEGAFGVVTEVTWKVFRHMPRNRRYFSFIFPSWEDAVKASREISQGEFGMPAVFRISDQEETHHGLKLYGIDGTILDKLMTMRGYRPMERCLFLGSADGEAGFTRNLARMVRKICRRNHGMYLTGFPVKQWEPGRYTDPYMREDLQDYGILIDTLETSVRWDNLLRVHREVRKYMKRRPHTICLAHCSHFYPQGTNLYFIFMIKEDSIAHYVSFQEGIINAIEKSGGSLSHHHGVGRMMAPWMERHLGAEQMDVLRALKNHFDPNGIMNPGGQMGLDLKVNDWRKLK